LQIYAMPGHLIRRLHQRSMQVFQTRMKAAGLDMTSVQFAAMDAVHANPGIDQARVASLIAYDRATIGGVIDRLQHKGWLTRVVKPQDRRARALNLTGKGEAVLAAAWPVVRGLQSDILAGLEPGELAQLVELMKKVALRDAEV